MEFGKVIKVSVWAIIGLIAGYIFIGWALCAILAFLEPEEKPDDDICYLTIALIWPIALLFLLIFGVYVIFQKSINAISISTYNKRKRKQEKYPPKE